VVVVMVNYYYMYDVGGKTSHTAVTVRGREGEEQVRFTEIIHGSTGQVKTQPTTTSGGSSI
jgi:hypothetical protein